jgi:hypothetical protein
VADADFCVDWGETKVKAPDAPKWPHRSDIEIEQKLVELDSGMIGVVPCERLAELLMKNDNVMRDRLRQRKDDPNSQTFDESSPSRIDKDDGH